VCRPIRTFSSPVWSGHGADISDRCASSAPVTAPAAEENTTTIPSPIVEYTTPPWCPNAARSVSLCKASDRAIASGTVSHRRVDPSMSVKRKVTVPAGRPASPGPPAPVGHAPVPTTAPAKLSLSNTARSSASSRSSSRGVAKVRYDTFPAARMASIIAASPGSRSGAGRLRYNSMGFPAASRYSSSRPEISIPGATQPYRCQ